MDLAVPEGYTTALVVLTGALRVNGSEPVAAAEVGLFDRTGTSICIDCAHDATALLLCGAPIEEPIVGYGPFVMNSPRRFAKRSRITKVARWGTYPKWTRCADAPVLPALCASERGLAPVYECARRGSTPWLND